MPAGAAARRPPVSVFVASIPSKRRDMTVERMAACAELWAAGIDADMLYAAEPKIGRQVRASPVKRWLQHTPSCWSPTTIALTVSLRCVTCAQAEEAAKASIPLMVVLGEDECERGEVSLKHMATGVQVRSM